MTEPRQIQADAERERADRIREMLERWAREDVRDEPEWEPDEVERVHLRPPAAPVR